MKNFGLFLLLVIAAVSASAKLYDDGINKSFHVSTVGKTQNKSALKKLC